MQRFPEITFCSPSGHSPVFEGADFRMGLLGRCGSFVFELSSFLCNSLAGILSARLAKNGGARRRAQNAYYIIFRLAGRV